MSITVTFNIILTIKIQLSAIRQACKRKKATKISNKVKEMKVQSIRWKDRRRSRVIS